MFSMARVINTGQKGQEILVCNARTVGQKFSSDHIQTYRVSNSRELVLNENDIVELFLPPMQTVLSVAMVFFFPLGLFPVGYNLARAFPRLTFLSPDAISFLVGFVFLVLGIPLGAIIRRTVGATAIPGIMRVVSPAEASLCQRKQSEGCGSCHLCR